MPDGKQYDDFSKDPRRSVFWQDWAKRHEDYKAEQDAKTSGPSPYEEASTHAYAIPSVKSKTGPPKIDLESLNRLPSDDPPDPNTNNNQ